MEKNFFANALNKKNQDLKIVIPQNYIKPLAGGIAFLSVFIFILGRANKAA